MPRLYVAATLAVLSTAAFAQSADEVKGLKWGTGCTTQIQTLARHLGVCSIADTKSRIWCPNGQIFDRGAWDYEKVPSSSVVRAICGLNQVM
jgi:hypothetical protein